MADQNEAVPLLTADLINWVAQHCKSNGSLRIDYVGQIERLTEYIAAMAAIADGRAVVVSAAELAAKDQQIADLTKAAECSAAAHAGMVAVADALCAENEALRVDAERYRWLRNSALVYLWEGHDDSGWTPSCGADVDLAADEARPETIAKERQS